LPAVVPNVSDTLERGSIDAFDEKRIRGRSTAAADVRND
jgi:hypothetical protein